MKTVKISLLAVVIATAVSPSAFAGDTIEAAATELEAIQPGMSHEEVDQKIGRFMIRTGNTEAAQNYLFSHGYMSPETGDNIYPEQTQADRDAAQDTAIQNAQTTANTAVSTANEAHQAITSAQTEIDASKAAIHKNTDDIIEQKNILRAQQDQINDTQKTVAATGDVQNAARYQSMVNAKLAAENEASTRASEEQGKKIDALSSTMTTVSQSVATENQSKELEEIHGDITKTNTAVSKLAAQQQIDSVHYGEQIQNLVQDSTDTHQQLSTTQRLC